MFKIGHFSKLTRISVRMLRHYDEIGLLKPHSTDSSTGYRFYCADQFPRVNRIQVLKAMGFSLAEISGLLDRDLDSQQLLSLLENRRRKILEAIAEENEKLLRLQTLIKLTKAADKMNYDISVKGIPSYKVLSLRRTISAYNAEGRLWQELGEYAKTHKLNCNGPNYAIYHDEGYKESDVDVEVTMCITEDIPGTDQIKVRALEAIPEMAVVLHRGPYEEMTSAYQALGEWMGSNGYELNGPTRAIYHKGPWCEKDSMNYLTEIQAPVQKKE